MTETKDYCERKIKTNMRNALDYLCCMDKPKQKKRILSKNTPKTLKSLDKHTHKCLCKHLTSAH